MKRKYNSIFILIAVFALAINFSDCAKAQVPATPVNGTKVLEGGIVPPPPNSGGGSGAQQIGGNNTIPSPPNPGGGSGSQQIGGSGSTLPEPPNPGGGNGSQQIGGGDTIPEPPNPGGGGGFPMGTELQTITIPDGWSGISSRVIPHFPNTDSLLAQEVSAGNLIFMQHFSQVFWPAFNINTIGNWETHEGYTIKVLQETHLDIYGFKDSNDTIQFVQGWNYLPIISDCDVVTNALFGDIEASGKLVIVYEIAGSKVYAPLFGVNTLPVLHPGKAYMVKVTAACSLSFPDCMFGQKNAGTINNSAPITPWTIVAPTSKQQFIFFTKNSFTELQPGDILGGFTKDGICCGITEFEKTGKNHVLVVFGDDPTTPEKDGFLANEQIKIRIYRPSKAEADKHELDFDNGQGTSAGTFMTNGITVFQNVDTKTQE